MVNRTMILGSLYSIHNDFDIEIHALDSVHEDRDARH
eukprot:SAG31_NODE_14695_length_792_cov_1.115440_1_plen_36_part_10